MDLIQQALITAYDLHKEGMRKGGTYPYFVHILDVAKYVMYETKDPQVIAAALLHDSIEDTSYTKQQLKKDFPEKVVQLVLFCTEPENRPDKTKTQQQESWKRRKQHSISNLTNATREELLVFVSDKVANLLSIHEDILHKTDVFSLFNASKQEVQWYYKSVHEKAQKHLANTRLMSVYTHLLREVFE